MTSHHFQTEVYMLSAGGLCWSSGYSYVSAVSRGSPHAVAICEDAQERHLEVRVKKDTALMSLNVAYNPFECCKYQPHENTLI